MSLRARLVWALACCASLGAPLPMFADDDHEPNANPPGALQSLDEAARRAVGIVVAHPAAATVPERIEALGLVLDATSLIADLGEAAAAAAAEQAASAELARLRGLYQGGAGASLKMIEAAQVEQARTRAQAQTATARLALNWAPLATMSDGPRQKVIDASLSGHSLLLRADLAGRHSVGVLPYKALLDVDGIGVPGRVLGVMRQTTDIQSASLLIELTNVPAGLASGARVPVSLFMAARKGLIVPRDAVLYDESGAYVYKQSKRAVDAQKTAYSAARVTLLLPYGDGWLVTGVENDDDIVVRGAGVLWSLQGVGANAVDDDD